MEFFICFAFLEGIEKSRREAELFCVCQFINFFLSWPVYSILLPVPKS